MTGPNLRKRKAPPQAEDSPVRETKRRTTKRKGKGKPVARDPVVSLNHDIVDILFSYLSEADLVRCERVSRTWRDCAKEWMVAFGCRVHFPHTWKPNPSITQSRESAYDAYKQKAQCRYNVYSGHPTSVREFSAADIFILAGNYVAWSLSYESYAAVMWQSLERSEDGSVGEAMRFSGRTYLRGPESCRMSHVAMNPDGILLLQIDSIGFPHPRSSRSLVISPTDKKILWRQGFPGSLLHQLTPLLIGARYIYCARRHLYSFDLVAVDFQTHDLIYHAPGLAKSWASNPNAHRISPYVFLIRWQHYRLLRPDGGNELILELSAGHPNDQRHVSVFNGPDGQLLQKISMPAGPLNSVTLNRSVNTVAIVSQLTTTGPLDAHPALQKHWLVVVRRFSCQPGGRLKPEPADVIFASKEVPEGIYSPTQLKIAVDAFTMSAVSSSPNFRPGAPSPPPLYGSVAWKVCGHSLTVTTDDDIRDLAQEVIRDRFSPDPPALGHCFLAGNGTALTLPPRAEGNRRRRAFKLPKSYDVLDVSFAGNGLVLGYGGPKYLVQFS